KAAETGPELLGTLLHLLAQNRERVSGGCDRGQEYWRNLSAVRNTSGQVLAKNGCGDGSGFPGCPGCADSIGQRETQPASRGQRIDGILIRFFLRCAEMTCVPQPDTPSAYRPPLFI